MQRIVVIDQGYDSYAYEQALFKQHGYQLEIFTGERHDRLAKVKFAHDAVGMFVRWTVIDASFLEPLSQLKAIVRYGTGYDNIDLGAVKQRHIRVANVQGYASHSVSDHALMLLLACMRGLLPAQVQFRTNFTQPPFLDIPELHEMTLGIIGLGRIGGALCRKARGLFARVLADDPYISAQRFSELGAEPCTLEQVLRQSDAISLHCNLTEETFHLLDHKAFAMMKKRPILINTARGPVVEEMALYQALQKNQIHSAGLDVFTDEPPGKNMQKILQHPRVLATGHYAWYSSTAAKELQKRAADNLLALLQGREVEDEL